MRAFLLAIRRSDTGQFYQGISEDSSGKLCTKWSFRDATCADFFDARLYCSLVSANDALSDIRYVDSSAACEAYGLRVVTLTPSL